jgi:hypothetical protein
MCNFFFNDTGATEIYTKIHALSLHDALPISVKVKVKVTLVQALRLCTGRAAHRGSRRIALRYRH